MTMTMTTLIEDGTNMCWHLALRTWVTVSRPETWIGLECSWLMEGSGNTVRGQYVKICAEVASE